MSADEIVGHKTYRDGDGFRHEPLRRSEAEEIHRQIEERKARMAALMPDEKSAINMLFEAWLRLKDFGFNDACYCPKDGSEFQAIEAGSTGIHRCTYDGKWPDGHYWIRGDGDIYPSRPVLFRTKDRAAAEIGKEMP